MSGNKTEGTTTTLSFRDVLNKAAGSAVRGGVAGAAAMGANVGRIQLFSSHC